MSRLQSCHLVLVLSDLGLQGKDLILGAFERAGRLSQLFLESAALSSFSDELQGFFLNDFVKVFGGSFLRIVVADVLVGDSVAKFGHFLHEIGYLSVMIGAEGVKKLSRVCAIYKS